MYNSEVPHLTSGEVLSQVSSYFDAVDNAIAMGDTNKRYQPATNTCYGPPVPVQANSYTTVVISPTADNTADIYNGYIYAEMNATLSITGSKKGAKWESYKDTCGDHMENPQRCWAGFKDAMDAIEKYEILANGITIYTQNHAIEESFVTACGLPEAAKRADPFSRVRHKDVFRNKQSQSACGVYLTWEDLSGITTGKSVSKPVTIKLKIDLRRFLPLSNIKYLPAFAGKIELRLYFSTAGMVCTPVLPRWKLSHASGNYNVSAITAEFQPLGESFSMLTEPTAWANGSDGTIVTETFTLNAERNYVMDKCETVIHCFGLSSERYDALVQKYMQTPLTFPTQTLAFTQMSNMLNSSKPKTVQTVTPRFVDSIFFLFPFKATHRSCFWNPTFDSIQLQCGGYGCIPDIAYATWSSAKMIEDTQNALNLNADATGLNKDVMRAHTSVSQQIVTGFASTDQSNFIIGFPTEPDATFQQGQTSNTPITYTLVVSQTNDNWHKTAVATTPIMGMLIDSTFSIQVRADGAPPVVEVGAFDITSPVMM